MQIRRLWLLAIFAAVAAQPALAEDDVGSAVGDRAPEISATTWLNTEEGESPLEGDVDPKLVLLEFWGTWCGPCVRSMPKIQSLWDRYRDKGLLVIAITRENAGEVRGFLKEKGYTMPVGCDPSQTCIGQYALEGWPTSVILDRTMRIVWRGNPSGAEAQVEKGLGLESSPNTLLSLYLEAAAQGDKDALRQPMERLVAKAPAAFDLRAWAEGALAADAAALEKPKALKAKAACKLLDKLAKQWGDEPKRTALLQQLAGGAPEAVDLGAWIRPRYQKAFPFKTAELKALLEKKRYATIIDMFVDRAPSGSVYKLAGKDDGLVAYCDKNAPDAWTFARKATMGRMYWMSDDPPPEDFDSEAFSRDISVNGIAFDDERKRVVGIIIGGGMVTKQAAEGYARNQMARSMIMNAIAGGQALKPSKLAKKVEDELAKIVKGLKRKYG